MLCGDAVRWIFFSKQLSVLEIFSFLARSRLHQSKPSTASAGERKVQLRTMRIQQIILFGYCQDLHYSFKMVYNSSDNCWGPGHTPYTVFKPFSKYHILPGVDLLLVHIEHKGLPLNEPLNELDKGWFTIAEAVMLLRDGYKEMGIGLPTSSPCLSTFN